MKLSIFLGSLIGLFLGYIIKRYRSLVHKGPSSTKIQQTVYKYDGSGGCYRFTPIIHVCPPSVRVDEMEHSDDDSEFTKE
jgi:hypothetical protein